MLAIDNSKSMRGDRFAAAKAAAYTFLDEVPADVWVGLVTFGDTADRRPDHRPRGAQSRHPRTWAHQRDTALFDGAALAADATGPAAPEACCCSPTATRTAAAP